MYQSEPPSYMESEAPSGVGGFPMGYFMIRSKTSDRVWDVETGSHDDSTEVILWPCRETSRVSTMRDHTTDNQVFFIDTEGALCSKASGHAIDVEGGKLVLRHRRPVTLPFPNAYSHPLPLFEYLSDGAIAVRFPVSSSAPRDREFLVAALPSRRPRTILDNVADTLTSAATTVLFAPLSLTGLASPGPSQTSHATVDEIEGAEFTLQEHELADEDVVNEEDADDNPERVRHLRVFQKDPRAALGPQARARRQWEIVPILREKVQTGTGTSRRSYGLE
ncbi:hypothetical protein EXIGLDRAFT_726508 [Exidia glandulosa HHB12029]|uniref:Uncharacterized protein n=1 Tax=Exidia glandulosa HHB12029 TaxID=1314781 RepID=A0A165MBD9_EXIGL|nr:hypothetical protein EXIGLDRAFT_726508 [Exidia glandulosa HHB12029]